MRRGTVDAAVLLEVTRVAPDGAVNDCAAISAAVLDAVVDLLARLETEPETSGERGAP